MSGHSKWANIKHKKGKADALRGKLLPRFLTKLLWQYVWAVLIPLAI